MFDTLDIIVPEVPGGVFQPVQTAFGPTDDLFVYCSGREWARRFSVADAGPWLARWIGARVRGEWVVLSAWRRAAAASARDEDWRVFLSELRALLEASREWWVVCEADCDQHPFEEMRLSAAALVDVLDECRRTRNHRFALRATHL